MPYLRQSTAQTIRFGPFLDATDGVTEEVALTITPALRRLSKDGGAFAAASGAVNATHDSDGWYSASLTTTDTNTVGELILNVQVPATHLPVWMRWWVLEEAVYDAMYGAAAAGPLQPTTAGRTLDVTAGGEAGVDFANIAGTLDAANIGANAITAAKIAAAALEGKGDWNIGKTGYSLTVAPLTAAQVNAEVDTALADANLDHLVGTATGIPAIVSGTYLDQITRQAAGAFDRETDSLQVLRDRGDAAWATAAGFSTHAAADVWAVGTRVLTAGTNLNDISPAEVNAEVVDVIKTDVIALPGQTAPPLAPTMEQAVAWLYKVFRNRKTQTATQWSLLADDKTTVDAKATVSDDATTAIKQEIVAGP